MGRPFGLGLRSQLMLALIVAFGAAFVLLSLVTARLDESENVPKSSARVQPVWPTRSRRAQALELMELSDPNRSS